MHSCYGGTVLDEHVQDLSCSRRHLLLYETSLQLAGDSKRAGQSTFNIRFYPLQECFIGMDVRLDKRRYDHIATNVKYPPAAEICAELRYLPVLYLDINKWLAIIHPAVLQDEVGTHCHSPVGWLAQVIFNVPRESGLKLSG